MSLPPPPPPSPNPLTPSANPATFSYCARLLIPTGGHAPLSLGCWRPVRTVTWLRSAHPLPDWSKSVQPSLLSTPSSRSSLAGRSAVAQDACSGSVVFCSQLCTLESVVVHGLYCVHISPFTANKLYYRCSFLPRSVSPEKAKQIKLSVWGTLYAVRIRGSEWVKAGTQHVLLLQRPRYNCVISNHSPPQPLFNFCSTF